MEQRPRHLLTLLDYSPEEILNILTLARYLKSRRKYMPVLRGKVLLLYFEKPSTRTRISLEVAMKELGGDTIYVRREELQLIRGETLADTARVLSKYVHGIAARVYSHRTLEELAEYSSVPIINALSDKFHPLQALADALTIWEKLGTLTGVKVVFVGDGNNNVTHSLLVIGTKLGWRIWVACPRGYEPDPHLVKRLREESVRTGAEIHITHDLWEAVKGADVVYTDVWVSMGKEHEAEVRRRIFEPYRVTREVMEVAKPHAIFMHCLPARRGEEVTSEVIDGPRSVVWDQAENRLHTTKAVLVLLLRSL